jgi:hypothetical protein
MLLLSITWTRPTREAVQVPITLSNVAQVDLLFEQIIKGNKSLNLALVLAI